VRSSISRSKRSPCRAPTVSSSRGSAAFRAIETHEAGSNPSCTRNVQNRADVLDQGLCVSDLAQIPTSMSYPMSDCPIETERLVERPGNFESTVGLHGVAHQIVRIRVRRWSVEPIELFAQAARGTPGSNR
jgi:hypothetical protein